MDKQNYTLRNIRKQDIKKYFYKIRKKLEKKLKSRNLIKRKRVVKNYRILIQAIFLLITQELSFQRLSDIMAFEYQTVMSDTAWRKQILKIAPDFFEATKQCLDEGIANDRKQHCYALDATCLSVKGFNDNYFRIHTQYDIDTCYVKHTLITDKHTAESMTHFPIEEGSIYFADRAYGRAKQFEYLINNKADFIVRISPFHIKLYKDYECTEKLDLYENIGSEKFSLKCFFKSNEKIYPIRIVGIKKPLEKQKNSEKKVRKKAQKNQYKASEKSIEFSKWFMVATTINISATDKEIAKAYRNRWQIELLFKRMKTLLNFRSIRRSSFLYSKTIVSLWLSVGFIICAFQVYLTCCLHLSVSNFNVFSLIKYIFS